MTPVIRIIGLSKRILAWSWLTIHTYIQRPKTTFRLRRKKAAQGVFFGFVFIRTNDANICLLSSLWDSLFFRTWFRIQIKFGLLSSLRLLGKNQLGSVWPDYHYQHRRRRQQQYLLCWIKAAALDISPPFKNFLYKSKGLFRAAKSVRALNSLAAEQTSPFYIHA